MTKRDCTGKPRKTVDRKGLTIVVLLLGFTMSCSTSILNKRWKGKSEIVTSDGTMIEVREKHSDPRYIVILPHSYGFELGRDKRDQYMWEKNGVQYERETFFIPIVIEEADGHPYVVEFDRETDFSKISFRLYRNENGGWAEIPFTEFPKKIAVQNKWLINDTKELLEKMNPEEYWFRKSLTGQLWIYLETGKQCYQTDSGDEAPAEFFRQFKKQHLSEYVGRYQRPIRVHPCESAAENGATD
jgi:hypothetical protein